MEASALGPRPPGTSTSGVMLVIRQEKVLFVKMEDTKS